MIWTGPEENRWNFHEGDAISPRLRAIRRLGAGDLFESYLAEDVAGRKVVAKMLRRHLTDEPSALAALRHEAALLEEVDHPGVIRLLEKHMDGWQPHLVLSFIPGDTLRRQVEEKGALQNGSLLQLGAGLADALAHLHQRSILHLDVKPGNVVLEAITGKAVLIDLGIARRLSEARGSPTPAGTAPFTAPELCLSERPSSGADVFGLGATLWFAATGSTPWPSPDIRAPADGWPQVVSPLPEGPGSVRPDARAIVRSCLARLPEQRPTAPELQGLLGSLSP